MTREKNQAKGLQTLLELLMRPNVSMSHAEQRARG